jgi:cobalt/nickel transport system permease protein
MKREQQLKRLSLSGLAAGLLLLVVPEQAFAMHIMEGFLPPLWALAWWMLFLPCLWYGLVRLRRIVAEDSNQKVLLALCGAFIFVLGAENPIRDGQLLTPDRGGPGGYPLRAGRGGCPRRDCAAVSGAAAGARWPDNAWGKRHVDGGDRACRRLSGLADGLSRGYSS